MFQLFDEAVDALGDVALMGWPVLGHLTVHKSGHALNHKLVQKVLEDARPYDAPGCGAGSASWR